MHHRIGAHTTRDGLKLLTREWQPDEPKAALLVVHGISEHSGRYARVASELTERGVAIHAYDHRGHGRSDGERVFVKSFDEYVRDLDEIISSVKAKTHELPFFLLGHSLGGLIVARYIVEHSP
ncbi:MAG: alpha/beta fold hydrolase, partial [Rubricoccaceae bacterium]|nr:alpha/beta fold hydrolase [Rubricoccaceae bacterium]